MNATVLILRDPRAARLTPCAPESFTRPRLRFARNLVEVKAYLLRCLRKMETGMFALPNYIMVDAGERDADIKSELSRWLDQHPRLRCIQVVLPTEVSWMARCWSAFGRCMKWW